MTAEKFWNLAPRLLLWSVAITPLLVSFSVPFPYPMPKMVFFRLIVEAALALVLGIIAYEALSGKKILNVNQISWRSTLFILCFLLLASLAVSTVFAENSYRAFWGSIDRQAGLFGYLHYFVFLGLCLRFFNKKDWQIFWAITLIVAAIIIGYAFLQYFGWGVAQKTRVESTLGNSAFLATHMIFIIIAAGIVGFNNSLSRGSEASLRGYSNPALSGTAGAGEESRYTARTKRSFFASRRIRMTITAITVVLAVIVIFMTGTRGAILGLLAGFVVSCAVFVICSRIDPAQTDTKDARINANNSNRSRREHTSSPSAVTHHSARARAFRVFAGIALAAAIIFGGVFFATRTNPFWQKVPGLERVARISFQNPDISTKVRFMSFNLAWEAWKQKPLLGWGPDNFLLAYSKNFNPDFNLYGEFWLDRAHNIVLDTLVAQGIVGLFAYIGLLAVAIWTVMKSGFARGLKAFLTGGIAAYFVQNLVLLDQLMSLVLWFALLGFIIVSDGSYSDGSYSEGIYSSFFKWGVPLFCHTTKERDGGFTKERINPSLPRSTPNSSFHKGGATQWRRIFLTAVPATLGIFILGYTGAVFSYVPWAQAKAAQAVKNETDLPNVVNGIKAASYPYNFSQFYIRGNLSDFYRESHTEVFENPELESIPAELLRGQEELIAKEPYDPRAFVRLAEMYMFRARANPVFYSDAERILRAALKIMPKRQELHYYLAFSVGAQGRAEESIAIARGAVALSPGVWRAHYYLGLSLALSGLEHRQEAEKEFGRVLEINPELHGAFPGDLGNMVLIYKGWGREDKAADIILTIARGSVVASNPEAVFSVDDIGTALRHFIGKEDVASVRILAEYATKTQPQFAEDMAVLAELANKGDWVAIRNLFFE